MSSFVQITDKSLLEPKTALKFLKAAPVNIGTALNPFQFIPFSAARKAQYRQPNITEYESRKRLHVTHAVDDLDASLLKCAPMPEALSLENSDVYQRSWFGFWGKRVRAALESNLPRLVTLFPGHTLPALGHKGLQRRGALFYEQFLSTISLNVKQEEFTPVTGVDSAVLWPWRFIEKPLISRLSKIDEHLQEAIAHQDKTLTSLERQLARYIEADPLPVLKILEEVHAAWTNASVPKYNTVALNTAGALIRGYQQQRTLEEVIKFLFEVEALASYLTYFSASRAVGSGLYANNWLEVENRPLAEFRITELCQEDRLFEEFIGLSSHAFAPIVVNEYGCISDGNHRFIAIWIWNALRACSDHQWFLTNVDFQNAMAAFVNRNKDAMGEVALHQLLQHLGAFLAKPERHQKLLALQPLIEKHAKIDHLPAVLLMEYSAPTVLKEPFDSGANAVRFPASIYESIAKNSHMVLPARMPYHFTDCALLPWFRVI